MDTHFDLAIIGSGSGNTLATKKLSHWRIAIIEESTFGGTCTNVGCIPTKMYVYPADLALAARESSRLGVDSHVDAVRWRDIRDRIFGRIDAMSESGLEYRRHGTPNVTLFETHAKFLGPHELKLGTGQTITADRIVVATGSRAVVPEQVAASGVPFHTSDTVMRIDDLPRRVTILGGGYIGAEFGHVFSAFGAEVSMICRRTLLRELDRELADAFTDVVKDRWDLHLNTQLTDLHQNGDEIVLELDDGSTVITDLLLVATGRIPNTDHLGVDAAGLALHPDGRVVVDAQQRTSVPNVWALGDACTEHQLKHVANHEARVVAHNMAHPDDPIESDHRFVPAAVFTHPQLAYVGLNEEQATAAGQPFVTARQQYGSTAYGWAMEDTASFCKLLADPATGQLIGAHLMGEQASTLIQPLIQAMSFGLAAHEMARGQYWIHPALTEVVENALLHLPLD